MGTYAVVTGASSGIGKAICFDLAKRGYNLIIVSKNDVLLKIARQEISADYPDIEVVTIAADLTKTKNTHKVASECIEMNVPIEVLVNCAGFAVWEAFDKGNLEEQMAVVDLNIYTPLILIHKLLPVLKKEAQSYILNVSSTTTFQATPFMSTYSSSKVFIDYFSKCLSLELKGTNVHVSSLIPGTTKTNFSDRAHLSDAIIEKGRSVEMDADTVAKKAISSLFKGRGTTIPGLVNQLHFALTKILPSSLAARMTYSIYKK